MKHSSQRSSRQGKVRSKSRRDVRCHSKRTRLLGERKLMCISIGCNRIGIVVDIDVVIQRTEFTFSADGLESQNGAPALRVTTISSYKFASWGCAAPPIACITLTAYD